MSAEQNKALMRRMVEEIFNQGNMDMLGEFMAPEYVEREKLPPGVASDREGAKRMTVMLRKAFPDFKATIEDIIAEGDKVVVRMTWSGTQTGKFMGIPPTGKSVSFGVIDILRFSGDKMVEHWGIPDRLAMMQQLGVFPAPGDGEG